MKSTFPTLTTGASHSLKEGDRLLTPIVSDPIRVMLYDHTAVWSGGEIALYHLINSLNRNRFTPVVVLSEEGPLAEKLREANVETHILPLPSRITSTRKDSLGAASLLRVGDLKTVFGYVASLAQFIRRNHLQLVHTNSLKSDIIGGLAGRMARVPVLWHVRDRIEKDYLPSGVASAFRSLCRVLPTHVMVNSQATLRTLVRPELAAQLTPHTSPNRSRFSVVHDGTLARTKPLVSPAADKPLIGLIGRISPWKGQHIFLEAAAKVRQNFPEAKFQIIGGAMFGESDYEQQLYALSRQLNLEDCVEFFGFRSDVADCIDQLTLLVHASTMGEPFGQVVIEGMAAGKPVVATDGGGIPEIVQEGCTGLLVPMNDAASLASAICRILEDPNLASEMGRQGCQRVHEHFLVSHTARRVEQIYRATLDNRVRQKSRRSETT